MRWRKNDKLNENAGKGKGKGKVIAIRCGLTRVSCTSMVGLDDGSRTEARV